jgi:transposase
VLCFCYQISIVSEAAQPAAMSTPSNSSFLSSDLLEQLKAQLPESLFATVSGTFATYEKQLDTKSNELQYARLKIQLLEERLRLQRIAKYGPGSEKLSNLQLDLLEQEPGVSSEEVAAESEREVAAPASKERKKRKHPGRQTLPADLPRVERVIACTPEQCVCGNCGDETRVIGYEVSEVLDVEPARYFVQVTKREKRACKCCPEQGVAAAPLPARIIDKSLVSDGVIIDTVVNKYCDHNPLYRQSIALLRDAGIDISRATMCGWVMTIGEMLMPVVKAIERQILAGSYIQADETPVDVQTHDGSGTNHQAYLWQYGTPGGMTVFDFRMSRKREGPLNFLGNFEGVLQIQLHASSIAPALSGQTQNWERKNPRPQNAMPKTTTTKIRAFVVITCASAEERTGDFQLPLVVRRAASEAAGDFRTGLGKSGVAAREESAHESPVEIAVSCRVHHKE